MPEPQSFQTPEMLREKLEQPSVQFGQSVVWLAHPRFNVLLETVFNRSQQVTAPKATQWTSDFLLAQESLGLKFQNGFKLFPASPCRSESRRAAEKRVFRLPHFEPPPEAGKRISPVAAQSSLSVQRTLSPYPDCLVQIFPTATDIHIAFPFVLTRGRIDRNRNCWASCSGNGRSTASKPQPSLPDGGAVDPIE